MNPYARRPSPKWPAPRWASPRWIPLRWTWVALLPLAACAAQPKPPPAPPPPPPFAEADADFVGKAAHIDTFEIAISQLAASQSANPKIKSYATRTGTDHTANRDRLGTIADQHGATLPTGLTSDENDVLNRLKTEKGRAFDHDFIHIQIEGHREALPLFQTAARNATDPALKSYAADTAPVIQSHLDMATALVQHKRHHDRHHH